jgi:hypothetical protein
MMKNKKKRHPYFKIAQLLPNRSATQIRERWINVLDPAIKKTPWTYNEDRILLKYNLMYGNKWAKISNHLIGRYFINKCSFSPFPHPFF